jgi:hypothetical protein
MNNWLWIMIKNVTTLVSGSRPRQRLARLRAKKEAYESHSKGSFHFGSCNPGGLPNFWESDCKGQNSTDWNVLYIIEKLLERRCLKCVCMTHLDTSNISYGQKKGRESNWQFDSRPLKVKNRPNFLTFRWRATYHCKALDNGYNFALYLISIRGLHAKLWAPKVARVPIVRISGFPLGSPGKKWQLGVGLVTMHKVYYKGEGGGFPQVWAMVSLVSLSLFMARSRTKNVPTVH